MKFRLLILILFLALCPPVVIAENQPSETASRKIEVGMKYDETLKLLQEKKMKHLETKQISQTTKTISFRWDSHALTVPEKLAGSTCVLEFGKDVLVKIQMYSRKGILIEPNLQHIYIHSQSLW